jgi:hypothetical protein
MVTEFWNVLIELLVRNVRFSKEFTFLNVIKNSIDIIKQWTDKTVTIT